MYRYIITGNLMLMLIDLNDFVSIFFFFIKYRVKYLRSVLVFLVYEITCSVRNNKIFICNRKIRFTEIFNAVCSLYLILLLTLLIANISRPNPRIFQSKTSCFHLYLDNQHGRVPILCYQIPRYYLKYNILVKKSLLK